ncbi:unnamed protein product [Caenorhabditis angaria]|uniref:F-box domain-containing protein n=1 Tax=Caenorhabditis angaria TaxID=860376 RepID=A0A9P1I4M2_9PELO|nr:unnamed protein product [Caenorhabditis angaria]
MTSTRRMSDPGTSENPNIPGSNKQNLILDGPTQFRASLFKYLPLVDRQRMRFVNKEMRDVVDSYPTIINKFKMIPDASASLPVMVEFPNACRVTMETEGKIYSLYFMINRERTKIVTKREMDGCSIGVIVDDGCNIHECASKWATRLLTRSGLEYQYVYLDVIWQAPTFPRQCKAETLCLIQSRYSLVEDLMDTWISMFKAPIKKLQISSSFVFSSGIDESELVHSANELHIEGICDFLPKTYPLIESNTFVHSDLRYPTEELMQALILQFRFKYIGRNWDVENGEKFIKLMLEEHEKLYVSRSATLVTIMKCRKSKHFQLFCHYEGDIDP